MITAFSEIDMLPLIDKLTNEYEDVESEFAGIEMMPYFVKAASMALNEFPGINNQKINHTILCEYPSKKAIVYEVANLEAPEIANNLFESLSKRPEYELSSQQLSEVTFSIASSTFNVMSMMPGGSGSTDQSVSILTLHAIREKPMVINSIEVEMRMIMFVHLTYPKNMVTKDEAKGFLDYIKKKIESPEEIYNE